MTETYFTILGVFYTYALPLAALVLIGEHLIKKTNIDK